MQESEFTGCANKVQGRDQNRRVFSAVAAQPAAPCSAETANWESLLKPKPPPFAHVRARVDPFARFLYDDLVSGIGRALSSAVRAFGLHPKGRPFKSDSAHHCDASPFSGDVVQLVRTLPPSRTLSRTGRRFLRQ